MSAEVEAALYEDPFRHGSQEHVRPTDAPTSNARSGDCEASVVVARASRHGQSCGGHVDGLSRYIATPTVAKHRLFVVA